VAGSNDYDEAIRELVSAGRTPAEVLWDLMIDDVQHAADVFRPVHQQTDGGDGLVSIEVPPDVAGDTDRSIAMARELRERCNRPNVMVKIPGTRAGLPAIEAMLAEGANINVTLLFSTERYAEVVDAFMNGLEAFGERGGRLESVHSVASFFVSRVDTKVDALLDERLQGATGDDADALRELRGAIGIANSKVAYSIYRERHAGVRWESLARAGARPQRCLWASTSVKDPHYADTKYVESLVGPETIDTLPSQTLRAFNEHGRVERTLDRDLAAAVADLERLRSIGIDLDRVTDELEAEGVDAFARSYRSLQDTLTRAADQVKEGVRA